MKHMQFDTLYLVFIIVTTCAGLRTYVMLLQNLTLYTDK